MCVRVCARARVAHVCAWVCVDVSMAVSVRVGECVVLIASLTENSVGPL